MSRAGLPFARWLEAIEVYGSVNGVFGTKIIPQHLVPVSGRRFATLEANIRELVARGFALVHLRRNLADCIVSSLVAFAGGTWHVFDDDDRSRFEREIRLSAIDDALVQRQITHYLADFVVLRSVLRGHAVTELDYDAMTGAPAAAVEQVRRALALDPAPPAAHVPLPHRMSAASSAYGAVRCRVDDMIARRREPLAAIALRRIAAKTGFDAAGVRRCLGFDMDRLAAMLHSLDQVK